MQAKYRSRTEILYSILEATNGGASKTRIMYRAFLSYAQLQSYLIVLLDNGLVSYDQTKQIYNVTEKGIRFAKLCDQAGELISLIGDRPGAIPVPKP